MHIFNIVIIFVIFVLISEEFCVSVFIHPVLRQFEDEPQTQALSLLTGLLGGVMPVWYGGHAFCCLRLRHGCIAAPLLRCFSLVIDSGCFVVRRSCLHHRLAGADQKRIAARSAAWKQQHRRWDNLPRLRVLVLAIAAFCPLWRI